ncbi:UPF0182 family protein [Methylocaldum sp.]|uniref:UPF0182 family protein n=1 Tax=Methylocaldum sp. TaxID=1969727 RepID=UPI002D532132|nr:UPF0182 family protein [Methylocaldum sp.]HYE37076.1 UPF0182 family protein [Methylocaldum sp.]
MPNWKRLLMFIAAAVFVLAVALLTSAIALTNFIVDYWWHDELGYGGYFWLKILYRYILWASVTLFFFFIFFLNFWAASRYLGVDQTAFASLGHTEGTRYRRLLKLFQTGSLRVYTPLSFILAVLIAIPFYKQWNAALLFLFAPSAGVFDPVFGNDVSFYMFSYPIFALIQKELLIASVIATLAIALLYWLEHRLLPGEKREWPIGARIHLSGLVIITSLIVAWGFILDRFGLLYTDVHEPQFFGPGFIELRYHLPLIWLSVLTLIGAVIAGLVYIHRGKGLTAVVGLAIIFAISLGFRQIGFIPAMIDRFVVKPNPVKIEQEFMQNNINATLAAYDLNDIKTIDVMPSLPDQDILDQAFREHLYNIPVWDPEYLDDVYSQMQGIRPYYRFPDVDIARYVINGRLEQVNLSAREVNIAKLPPEAQNWENTHLRYTHGYGTVITPAAQDGETPMKWFLRDLTLQSGVGFTVEKPDIYFGEENLTYAIVPNQLNVVGISSFDEESSYNYTGSGGVPISSLFRRLLFAIYFRDEKLFFSVNIRGDSRALFHRNVVDRIKRLTPYLSLDNDPYAVVTPKRIYWIVDAYTTSGLYPVSKTSITRFNRDGEDKQFNYIRNSVKIVIDAFDGNVDYYVANPNDPIIQGYRKAYPGVFKDMSAMLPMLREQLRYPKDMFTTQMSIYARYHQTNPALFFQQAETWDFAMVNDTAMKPFFFTTYLLEGLREPENFVLINPMTPIGRSNLSVLAVAGTPAARGRTDFSKEIVLYRFSREVQVEGPSQVSALIDQDPEIARQFALWDQKGSHVLRGRIIVLPVGRSVLYVQPVYIVSTGTTRIPELQRIILSMGNVVIMDASLERGMERLQERLKEIGPQVPPSPPTVPVEPPPKLPEFRPM